MDTKNNFTNSYRFILDKSNRKFLCPQCQKRTFVRYTDTETKEYLPEHYGRCDRESKCAYNRNPYSDGYAKDIYLAEKGVSKVIFSSAKQKHFFSASRTEFQPEIVPFDFITFKKTLDVDRYQKNVFIQNLLKRVKFPFPADEVTELIQRYRLGTVSNGAICFPFIDINDNVRAVQVKQFDNSNHTTNTTFLHSIIMANLKAKRQQIPKWLEDYSQQAKKITCLFGEHLLNRFPKSTIALVEAPKTAIYCSFYLKKFNLIWLAVYNKSSFSFDKLKVLQGRKVLIFPDLSKDGITFNEWENKAKKYEEDLSGTTFTVSRLLENLAPLEARNNGSDIADFLIEQDWRKFQPKKQKRYEDYTKEERLLIGLKVFPKEDLSLLAEEMFSGNHSMSNEQIKTFLSTELNNNDIEDLMDILCIRKIIKATEYPNYEIVKF